MNPKGVKSPAPAVPSRSRALLCLALALLSPAYQSPAESQPTVSSAAAKVSYYRDVRPLLQANCQGCHQPAKNKGGYVMTDFKRLLTGGDSEGAAIVPQEPEKSSLLKMVTPQDGEVRMPKGKTPLMESEVALLKSWIAQGAEDDTPADAKRHYDLEHPPAYSRLPVISALDISPDGKLLAVAGFHEVFLYENILSPKGAEEEKAPLPTARLIGLSERVQSLRFSPDGQWLAVAGGDPARLGEIQIWDVAKLKLTLSAPVSYDTLYGVSWSPDSKLVAFGCPDNTVRAIEASSGKQVVQMGSHSDWVMSTAFSVKGDHIVSGGRDMSVKLTEIATQRFVDNVTSITPGALKGGVLAVATHPTLEHFVTAGSDGLPKVYRIFREIKREIGDDAQLIADLFPMTGRVFSARFSPDGKRIACGGGLDRAGELLVCSYDFTNDVPKELRELMGKVPGARNAAERKKLEDYKQLGIHELARVSIPQSEIYSVAFAPDGNTIAAAGSDGMIRLFNATKGSLIKEFPSVPIATETSLAKSTSPPASVVTEALKAPAAATPESLPNGAEVASLEIQPGLIKFTSPSDYAQLLVTGRLNSGDTADATRLATITLSTSLVEVSPRGILRPLKNGTGEVTISLAGQTNKVPIEVSGLDKDYPADFIRDVSPVIAHLGCNAGTCHGSKEGKNGFKLSLRGYDPESDLRALTDDLASRRVNIASPDDSLMLLKAVAEVPHEGGRRMARDSKYYQILRQWIKNGANLDLKSPRVVKIEIFPQDPVVQTIGSCQQMRILASYADGVVRDVTAEGFVDSGNTDVATIDATGLIKTLRRGEAPVLARYEGNYVATTVTVMGDRSGFVWQEPPTWGKIDELVAAKWKRMKIAPSEICTDLEFIRRIYLDLTGLPPAPKEIRAFVDDTRETRVKRDEVVDRLIGSSDYVDYWANKWADLLQCNSKFLGSEGAQSFRAWIRNEVEKNTPYDQFAREILTATGSNLKNPAASYWKILRTPTEVMENTTQLFLATRFNCNKCHDHPFERWTQDQYYHLSAYFAQVSRKEDPASEGKKIGGTAVEGAQPLYEVVGDASEGEVKHDRTGKVSPPVFPYLSKHEVKEKTTRRDELAAWISSPDNRFFASSYANRLWGYLTGAGIIEPLDDIRAGNPPRNPALLEFLTREFIDSGFNPRHMMEMICKSRTYQLSIRPNHWNEEDKVNYSHAIARRLPAETLFDTVFRVTGSIPEIMGAKLGERAAQLSDTTMDTSGLLATLGRPARQSACECERSSDIRMGSVMALLSGPTISGAINRPTNELAKLVETEKDNPTLVNDVFLRVLNRPATDSETTNVLALLSEVESDRAKLTNELAALELKMAPVIAGLNQKRDEAIAHAHTNLAVYDEMTKTLRAELERRHQAEIAAIHRELRDYERLIPVQAAFWESKNNPADTKTTWVLAEPKKASATGKKPVKLTTQSDGSILSSAGGSPTDYRVITRSTLTNITGVMLEVLPDESLPNFGPGRAPDGNFVLSEFELKWAAGTNTPDQLAKFVEARADFSQTDFSVSQAIDGKVETGVNGWAVAGAPGTLRHTATFKLEHPIASPNGATLNFVLKQHYGDAFMIGRFRLYVTTSTEPLDFGLPDGVVQAARAPAGQRKPEQASAIIDYYRNSDVEFWKRKSAFAKASAPLPADPKLGELKQALALAEAPIHLDPYLVQLRDDVAACTRQSENKRLTVVQDLTWALVNSAGFLFNH
jgi:WD40 repeat protein/mono/diheme cytochrome c family protein